MKFSKAIEFKNKFSYLKGEKYPFSPGNQSITLEGLFIAPANPSLFDKYINFLWREGSQDELFDESFLKSVFTELNKLDLEVYVKLSLNDSNVPDYFLFDKLVNLPQYKTEEEEIYA